MMGDMSSGLYINIHGKPCVAGGRPLTAPEIAEEVIDGYLYVGEDGEYHLANPWFTLGMGLAEETRA